jgi:hypothetical protein
LSRFLASLSATHLPRSGFALPEERRTVDSVALAMRVPRHDLGARRAAVQITVIALPTQVREHQARGVAAHE